MALKLEYAPGQTPLDPDETDGLIPTHITTQGELNEWEQANITEAKKWLAAKRNKEVLSEKFCNELHKRMFDRTWKWAGIYRKSDKNIGCDWRYISVKLRDLLLDVDFWLQNKTYSLDETVIRFHHRLVLIHCFPNGNGRHARLMADTLLNLYETDKFTWGGRSLLADGESRDLYLAALRAADGGDFSLLMGFSRS